jgi:PhnB protein
MKTRAAVAWKAGEPLTDGRCEEAIAFYKKAVGAEVQMLMRWKDTPDKSMCTPENAERVMHSSLRIGESTLMMSDGRGTGRPEFKGISLSLAANDPPEAEKSSRRLAKAATCRCR